MNFSRSQTSLVMKVLEKTLKEEIVSLLYGKLNQLQLAYQYVKGEGDAEMFILDRIYKHHNNFSAQKKLLFTDFPQLLFMQPHFFN